MKLVISLLLVLSMLAATMVSGNKSLAGPVSSSQNPNANPRASGSNNKYRHKLPRNAVPGSTDERRAAWEALTPEQRQKLFAKIRPYAQQAKAIASKMEDPGEDDEFLRPSLADKQGNRKADTWRRLKKGDASLLHTFVANENGPSRRKGGNNSVSLGKKATSQNLWNHARGSEQSSRVNAEPTKGIDEFVRNSFNGLQPGKSDISYWHNAARKKESGEQAQTLFGASSGKYSSFQSGDDDGDGLPDGFENQLADEFTPYYHVSTNEPDHFARFGDFLPETVTQAFSPYPPISHFRVTPLGFSGDHSLAYLRVDYWTLWDHDSGFQYDLFCQSNVYFSSSYLSTDIVYLIDLVVQMNSDHPLDNERSAVLVAAPVQDPGNPSFSSDPAAYSALAFFLAAHENEIGDNSVILYPPQPIPATGPSHIELALARSKHASYAFDPSNPSFPDGLPLVPWYIIFGSYAFVDTLLFLGVICVEEWLALQYALDVSFFSCIVEHFNDSGGSFAGTRINIGEVTQPLNGSHFIQAGELYQKMTTAIPW
jgi:hypothetical protein